MFGTDSVLPDKSVHYVFSLKEAWFFLNEILRTYDSAPEFTYAVLADLTADVLGGERNRDPVGSHFDNALIAMHDVGISYDTARQAAMDTGELIIQAVSSVIPNFGSKVYKNAYQFLLKRPYDVYLSVDISVYTEADLPAPSARPYRL